MTMTLLLAGVALVVVLAVLAIILRAVRHIDVRRSVLLHTPAERAWESVGCLPTLLVGHGKLRAVGAIDGCCPARGQPEAVGSTWRAFGRWRSTPYWAEMEVVRLIPTREFAVRLVRDSLGTHRGIRNHCAALTIEDAGPGRTKLTWWLRADLRTSTLRLARIMAPDRLMARLLDVGLRSVKIAVDHPSREAAEAAAPNGSGDDFSSAVLPATPHAGSRTPIDPRVGRPDGRTELSR